MLAVYAHTELIVNISRECMVLVCTDGRKSLYITAFYNVFPEWKLDIKNILMGRFNEMFHYLFAEFSMFAC